MANKNFKLTIKTPEEEIYCGDATAVRLAAKGGTIKVLANHASLTATLVFSPVIVETEGNKEEFLARQGVFFFDNSANSATLLALYCEKKGEVNEDTAKDYLTFVEEQLAKGKKLSDFELVYLEGERIAVKEQLNV